jgi:hypothetical protein
MRILIQAGQERHARMVAELLYLKAWGYIYRATDLYGHTGFIVIREMDTSRMHPQCHEILDLITTREKAGQIVVWEVSLDWLVRQV